MTMISGLRFALFVFWLLSFPMNGRLLQLSPTADLSTFLVPHILSLFLAARFLTLAKAPWLWRGAPLVCVAATLSLLRPADSAWLVSLIGAAAALVCLQVCNDLHQDQRPVLSAGVGLIVGNILLAVWQAADLSIQGQILCVALAMFLLVWPRPQSSAGLFSGQLSPYLISLFIFHLVCGIMYGFVAPRFAVVSPLPGLELGFYLAAVLVGIVAQKRGTDRLFVAAIALAMLAFAVLMTDRAWSIVAGMFLLQAASGCSDMFVLTWLLRRGGGVREFGFALGAVCLGILCGNWLAHPEHNAIQGVALAGNLALSLALLSLFYFKYQEMKHLSDRSEPIVLTETTTSRTVPPQLASQLSEQEFKVLELVVQGQTYRDVAVALGITESTVKTYMKRIREKTGAGSKKDLLLLLED